MLKKLKDILVWYHFRPRLYWWTSNKNEYPNETTSVNFTYQQAWYGSSTWFVDGIFIFIKTKKGNFHCEIRWWKLRMTK